MNIFNKFFYGLRLRKAIQMADQAHKENGNRYYVVPSQEKGIKLVILDRNNFRTLKQKGYINRNARIFTLARECFYATTYSNGSGLMSPFELELRRQAFFNWVTAKRQLDKLNRKHKKR